MTLKSFLRLPVRIFRFPVAFFDHSRHLSQVRRVCPDPKNPTYRQIARSLWRSL
jgi:hypothetical protein